jgi:hypothetical protein
VARHQTTHHRYTDTALPKLKYHYSASYSAPDPVPDCRYRVLIRVWLIQILYGDGLNTFYCWYIRLRRYVMRINRNSVQRTAVK